MALYDDDEVTHMARLAFEQFAAPGEAEMPCGSYVSLALLLSRGRSSFVSAEHVARCERCQAMLGRLLTRRCPGMPLLRDVRTRTLGIRDIAVLERHTAGCMWCRLRIAVAWFLSPMLLPLSLRRHGIALTYLAAILILAGASWFGWKRSAAWTSGAPPIAHGSVMPQAQLRDSGQLKRPSAPAASAGATAVKNPGFLPLIAAFTLVAGGERSDGQMNQIDIPAATGRVRFKMNLAESSYSRYRVSLKSPEGDPILFRDARLSNAGHTLTIELPVQLLPQGDCMVSVSSIGADGKSEEAIEDYSIRIVRHR